MEDSSISMVKVIQIVELLQLTSKFFNDAAEIIKQRRLDTSDNLKSSKKRRKIKTKRHKSGYQVFLKEKMSELKRNPEHSSKNNSDSKMSILSSLVSQEWNKAGEQEKEIYKQKAEKLRQEAEKVNSEERKFEPSASLLKLLEDNDTIEESSSENEKEVKQEAIRSFSGSEDIIEEESD